jgi:ribonuclease G
MKEIMDSDRATHTILPLSKFNLMQITRERVRPEVNISTTEACPTCGGTGEINASLLLIDEMEGDLAHLMNTHTKLKLYCHPIFAAYLQKGFPSRRMNWFIKYKKWIRIYQNEDFAITEYKFFDEHDEEIKID